MAKAFASHDGTPLWRQEIAGSSAVVDMAVTKDRLLVAGAEFVFDTRSDGDVYEPQASDPPERWMWDLAAAGGRYFMAGAFFGDLDHPGDLDFAVRAYAYR